MIALSFQARKSNSSRVGLNHQPFRLRHGDHVDGIGRAQYFANQATYVVFLDVPLIVWSIGFRSVVVITSASHAEGRRFESCRKQGFSGVCFGKPHCRPKRGDGGRTQLKISRF